MCRSHVEGYKRCKGSAATKARESLRKSINYQSAKAGVSTDDWKKNNPEELESINSTYNDRLKRFGKNFQEELCIEDEVSMLASAEASTIVETFGFPVKGEKRLNNSIESLEDYVENSKEYVDTLNLSEEEEAAILLYTNDTYTPLNSYFLKKDPKTIFNKNSNSWKENFGSDWFVNFKDEEDLIDYSEKIDSALSHRIGHERTVYRGIKVRSTSKSVMSENDGKVVLDTEGRRAIMEKQYIPGSELVFDAYSSASDSIDIASNWSGAHGYWADSPTGILFEIKSSAGVPISHISSHDHEREVLLPRGMRFKIANAYWNGDKDEDKYSYDSTDSNEHELARNQNTLIVQLVEIDENGDTIKDHSSKYVAPDVGALSNSKK